MGTGEAWHPQFMISWLLHTFVHFVHFLSLMLHVCNLLILDFACFLALSYQSPSFLLQSFGLLYFLNYTAWSSFMLVTDVKLLLWLPAICLFVTHEGLSHFLPKPVQYTSSMTAVYLCRFIIDVIFSSFSPNLLRNHFHGYSLLTCCYYLDVLSIYSNLTKFPLFMACHTMYDLGYSFIYFFSWYIISWSKLLLSFLLILFQFEVFLYFITTASYLLLALALLCLFWLSFISNLSRLENAQ